MSSNIYINRICEYCNIEFIARTTVTRFCSHKCVSANYKARQKLSKVKISNEQTRQIKERPMDEIRSKEFLSVRDVSKLIGCSRQTVYTLINTGIIKGVNIKIKKTIIPRSEIDKLFIPNEPPSQQKAQSPELQPKPIDVEYSIADCYTLTEIQNKFGISQTGLQILVKKHNIPKIKKGIYAYVPKNIIENLFKQ